MPGIGMPPAADLAEAFLGAMMAAVSEGCVCEACAILRKASATWRGRLAGK